jgi:hypothetical protein
MKKYQKICVAFTVLVLSFSYSTSAYGASKSQKVIEAFENYSENIDSIYYAELLSASNLYQPQIDLVNKKIKDAKLRFSASNQVKVLKLGDNRNYWGNFDCPTTRPDCIYVDKGPLFQVGEVTSIKSLIADKNEYLDEIDIILGLGLIEIINLPTYQEASKTIRLETVNLNTITQQYKGIQNTIELKKYTTGIAAEIGLLAAQRAAKSPSNYDKAFVVALKFEQNRLKLNELASTNWKYINNYKALSSAISVARLSNQADSVSDNYSYNRAASINSSCGTAFTAESGFKSSVNLVASVYKMATKVSIKL